jgi:hypothetical protein
MSTESATCQQLRPRNAQLEHDTEITAHLIPLTGALALPLPVVVVRTAASTTLSMDGCHLRLPCRSLAAPLAAWHGS